MRRERARQPPGAYHGGQCVKHGLLTFNQQFLERWRVVQAAAGRWVLGEKGGSSWLASRCSNLPCHSLFHCLSAKLSLHKSNARLCCTTG